MIKWPEVAQLYPLKFEPIYQERMWGGSLMNEVLDRYVPAQSMPIGESWELSDRDDAMSVVSNGKLKGKTFREVLDYYKSDLTGTKVAIGDRFPLLVKLIDAGDRLSLQVHPDEMACKKIGEGAEPKTEMWYIVAARRDGKILAGLSSKATQIRLKDLMNKPEVEQLMQVYSSQPGDAYFIPSGMIHAIGGGNLILEIQQSSDTTYRISDWGRVDENGKSRELHVEKGLMAIDFMNRTTPRIAGVSDSTSYNRKFALTPQCKYFSVDDLRLASPWRDDPAINGSFHLISVASGAVLIRSLIKNGEEFECALAQGETALVPFAYGEYEIVPQGDIETVVVKTCL